jgi:acyl dehydratase
MVKPQEFPKITDSELSRLRQLMGVELEVKEPFNRYATADTIRHFAHGIGDANPLYADEDHGQRTRWGVTVAPPSFLFSCFGRGAPQGLRGIHAMWAGASFEVYEPIRAGDRIVGTVALTGLTPKESRFATRSILQEHTYTFHRGDGVKLADVKEWHMRTERDTARERGKHKSLEPAQYSAEDIKRIFADYDKEEIRGATPRYWDDVIAGEDVPHVVKGPLRVTDNVAWKVGWGFRPFTHAHKLGVEYYKKHPMAFDLNAQGVPDVPERVHWDPDFARRVGVPSSYDFGPQRVAWLCQVATNWMGDDGFIKKFWGEVRRFNLVGDTHWLKGKVKDKRRDGDEALAELDLWAYDQRGEETIRGGAVVALPSRS